MNDEFSVETTVSDNSPAPIDVSVDVDYDAIYDAVYTASYDAIAVYSQSVTDGQAINATALSYFQGILGNQFWPVDYVIYVGSPYYTIATLNKLLSLGCDYV